MKVGRNRRVWQVIPDSAMGRGEKRMRKKCLLSTYDMLKIHSLLSKLTMKEELSES